MRKNYKQTAIALILAIVSISVLSATGKDPNMVQAIAYTFGSQGNTVRVIQHELKEGGYYPGSIDGVYGSEMLKSVKDFQLRNGIQTSGIVDKKTLEALGVFESGKNTISPVISNRENDVWLLASLINGEVGGEPYIGQVAVGAVVLNRVKHPAFPNTISEVIYQHGEFKSVIDGEMNLTPSTASINAARDAINGWDPTNGAIYYWNLETAMDKRVLSIPVTISVGSYNFGIK